MSLEPENIQHELEKSLNRLTELMGDGFVRQIKPVLLANLERGRLQRFMDRNCADIPAYIECVAAHFTSLNGFIRQIQHERDAEVWSPLFIRMQTWAYNFFLRKGFSSGTQTQEIAEECATDAAVNLLNAFFPYDTEFDAWAHMIVQNACRKFIDRAFKKSAVPADQIVDLDDNVAGLSDSLPDIQHQETKVDLQNALALLTKARRTVVQLIYFDELEAEEVAQRMEKSVGAVYSLQFHALQDLRKILSIVRDKLNE